jgi:hypothetical protein
MSNSSGRTGTVTADHLARPGRRALVARVPVRAAWRGSRGGRPNGCGEVVSQVVIRQRDGFRISRDEVGPGRKIQLTGGGTQAASQAVAYDGRADAPSDGEGDTRVAGGRFRPNERGHRHGPGPPSSTRTAQGTEGALITHAADCHRAVVIRRRGGSRKSGREPMPTLEPASFENCPACPSGHPVPEAMSLGPLAIVGLVGPLHLGGASLEAALGAGSAAGINGRRACNRRNPALRCRTGN